MKPFQAYHLLIFLSLMAVSIAGQNYSMPGCNARCGNVRIPYPFGIGLNCAVNKWYVVDCKSSTPYLSALNHLEVLSVKLREQIVIVNTPPISPSQNQVRNSVSIDLGRSPFLFSKSHNKFVVQGCGNAVMMERGSTIIGCSTNCVNDTASSVDERNNCVGITCCQTTLPYYLSSYTIYLTQLERQGGGSAAFLMDKNSSSAVRDKSFIPVSLLWTLTKDDRHRVNCCSNYPITVGVKVDMGNSTPVDSWKCPLHMRYTGNSYLRDGCLDNKECRSCKGYCADIKTYDAEDVVTEWNVTCQPISSNSFNEAVMIAILVGGSITSFLGILAIIYTSYKVIKKAIIKRRRKSVFKRINGGLLLKQQEEIDPSLVDKTTLFTARELKKATHNFNENRIVGRGGQGMVYKGMLPDGRIVAVKKSKLANESQIDEFINEVVILSQINHRNVVKQLGCCLETEVPMLVYEFISNGTLYDRIHDESGEFPFSLSNRLQVATEVAQAICYLHTSTSTPIFHGDIKTKNILLDEKYRAKVSDFGTSRFVSNDQTHLTTLVKGTCGYLDPEYFNSSQLTDKSDVYSFGVVLVELLTGERPVFMNNRLGENRSLVEHFKLAMAEGRIISIFNATVIEDGTRDELYVLANLAMRCLDPIGDNRPTMKEVAMELEIIRASHIPSMVQPGGDQVTHGDEISML